MLKMHSEYSHVYYIQELKMVESEHCEDSTVKRNEFMQIVC